MLCALAYYAKSFKIVFANMERSHHNKLVDSYSGYEAFNKYLNPGVIKKPITLLKHDWNLLMDGVHVQNLEDACARQNTTSTSMKTKIFHGKYIQSVFLIGFIWYQLYIARTDQHIAFMGSTEERWHHLSNIPSTLWTVEKYLLFFSYWK